MSFGDRFDYRKFQPDVETSVRLTGDVASIELEKVDSRLRVEEVTQNHAAVVVTGGYGMELHVDMTPAEAEQFGEELAEAAREAQE